MYESPSEIAELQELLDATYRHAGPHLTSTIPPDYRLNAAGVVAALDGMCLLSLATVSADGRPFAAPVDGFFNHGRFWFGSSPESVRFRHIARNPAVSAVHLPGEHLCVTVHGRAQLVDPEQHSDFVAQCIGFYGDGWYELASDAVYARIEPDRMWTFTNPVGSDPSGNAPLAIDPVASDEAGPRET